MFKKMLCSIKEMFCAVKEGRELALFFHGVRNGEEARERMAAWKQTHVACTGCNRA